MLSRNKSWKGLSVVCLAVLLCVSFLMAFPVYAAGSAKNQQTQRSEKSEALYTNPSTGYRVYIEDNAGIIKDSDEEELLQEMKAITAYGNVAFKSINYNSSSTKTYIRNYYEQMFGTGSGTVFLIDMDNRNIWIHSNGAIYEVITDSYAEIITDNVYKLASSGDYYACALKGYSQILTLLQGKKIVKPMKYICNALLAVGISFILMYFVARGMSGKKEAKSNQILAHIDHSYSLNNATVQYVNTTRVYDPPSSSSSGSSGGGGGGGHSGGGGGHSF